MSILLIFCLLYTPTDPAMSENDKWLIEKVTQDVRIKPGTPIEVHNPYGDVRARSSEEMSIPVTAMVQKHVDDERHVTLEVEHTTEKLVIRVTYAGKEEDTVLSGGKRRADVSLFVPDGSTYLVRTNKGFIEAKGLKSDVDLRSKRGKIFLRNDGHAVVFSEHGNIDATLKKVDWARPASLETVVGDISVRLPQNASLLVDVKTSGELTTDYTVDIKHDERLWMKQGNAKIGDGKNKLILKSHSGNIKLLAGKWDVDG